VVDTVLPSVLFRVLWRKQQNNGKRGERGKRGGMEGGERERVGG
jgi:hypothetical protein